MSFQKALIHLFIPHHSNNHRARILHIDALSVYAIFFLSLSFLLRSVHANHPDVLGYATDIYIDQLLSATNVKRAELGLQPLALNSQLSQAAALKAQNMLAENYWAHNSPSGKTPWTFIAASGYRYTIAGENLAKNFMSSQGVVDAWMASPSHRDNIVKSGYKDIGFAVVNGTLAGEQTTLVVQMFGTTLNAVTTKNAEPIAQGRTTTAIISTLAPTAFLQIPTSTPILPSPTQPPVLATSELITQKSSALGGVTIRPKINLTVVNTGMVTFFLTLFIIVLVIDAIVVGQKRIVRVSGHNGAHVLFLAAILFLSIIARTGSIL